MGNQTVFALPEFKIYEPRYNMRMVTFTRYRQYYAGTIYNDSAFKLAHKLYAQTKALLSFLARAVDLDIALVPGVMGPWALKDGTAQAITTAQAQLYEWSEWPIVSDDWLEDGATLGECMLKIVPGDGLVQLQRLKPELCLLVDDHPDLDSERTPDDMALIVDRSQVDDDGAQFEYAEVITPTTIRTYKNGDPFGFQSNPPQYDNPLGFIPIIASENDSGARPTFAKCLPQLNSVNELASYLADIIGRHAEPQWAISGAEEGELHKSGRNVWYLPAGAKAEALLAQIDVPGVLEFIREIKQETKSNLPELAFDDLRSKAQIATETLDIQLVELDAKIWKMRRRYDWALVKAHQTAAMAAMLLGIDGLRPLMLPHAMDYKRPVRPISPLEQIRQREAELALEMQEKLASGDGMTSGAQAGESDRAVGQEVAATIRAA